jgi:hypothetical protein
MLLFQYALIFQNAIAILCAFSKNVGCLWNNHESFVPKYLYLWTKVMGIGWLHMFYSL